MTHHDHITGPPRKRRPEMAKPICAWTRKPASVTQEPLPGTQTMPNDATAAPACARTEEMTSVRHAVAAVEVDHAARNALLKIEGMALDLQGLLNIAIARNVEPYQQDIAVSSARNLASLIGVTCLAATSESIPSSVSLWLLGGQA